VRSLLIIPVLAALALGGLAEAKPAANDAPAVATAPLATAPADAGDALHAPAGVADCIWGEVPEEVREAVERAGTIDVIATAIKSLGADRDGQLRLAEHCGVPASAADPAAVVQHTLQARTLEMWTTGQLKSAYGVTDQRLAAAWARVGPDDKSEFAHWFGDRLQAPENKLDKVQGLMDALGLSGEDAATVVLYYAGSRALYEQLGGTI
jgi:hypothetical protein